MGLAIAKALIAQKAPQWKIHILDVKEDAGHQAVDLLGGAEHVVFHKVDITDYEQLAAAFKAAFLDGGRRRLDWVFANAGIFERSKYFDNKSDSGKKEERNPWIYAPPAPGVLHTKKKKGGGMLVG